MVCDICMVGPVHRGLLQISKLIVLPSTHRRKYSTYSVTVDPDQDDKSTQIKLCDFSRPHMRAFHGAWWGFFMAFFIWFAIAPLLPEIKKTLGLTKQEVWTYQAGSLDFQHCQCGWNNYHALYPRSHL